MVTRDNFVKIYYTEQCSGLFLNCIVECSQYKDNKSERIKINKLSLFHKKEIKIITNSKTFLDIEKYLLRDNQFVKGVEKIYSSKLYFEANRFKIKEGKPLPLQRTEKGNR